jgi:hypothetical protein
LIKRGSQNETALLKTVNDTMLGINIAARFHRNMYLVK